MSDLLLDIKKYVDGVKKLDDKIDEETIAAFKENEHEILRITGSNK